MLALTSRNPEPVKQLLDAGADVLAVNKEGKSVESQLWKVFDDKTKEMVQRAVRLATEERIDRICYLYSADNPHASRADAIQPTTPQLAAVRMYRALFGPDRGTFAAVFVGEGAGIRAIDALYDGTHDYIAFRKELTRAFGPDACQRFDSLELDGATWTFTLPMADESRLRQMEVDVQGDRAVCHHFPELERAGDVRFVKQGDGWRIDAGYLAPADQPEANLRVFGAMSRSVQKGRSLLRQSGNRMEDVKRAMMRELDAEMRKLANGG
jgi:hypothetical protein